MNRLNLTLTLLFCFIPSLVIASAIALSSDFQGEVSIKSWKTIRDDQIIHQELDFSCGAAALATLLKSYYGLNVTEADMIAEAGKDEWLSFADFKRILPKYGLEGFGLALDFDQLTKLKIPAIIYIETRAGPHFAVVRGINDRAVWLADPASGNNYYQVHQFLKIWETRKSATLKGKIFVVLPAKSFEFRVEKDFFGKPFNNRSLSFDEVFLQYLLND